MALTTTTRRHQSNFTRWGKWVLIGVLVGAAVLTVLLICCCLVLRRNKKSKAKKHAKDSELGAYDNHRSEKIHQPTQTQYNIPAAVEPVHAPPTRMEPVYNNNYNNTNTQPLAHDYTTVDPGYNNHNTRNNYDNTNGYQSHTATQGDNYHVDNQRMNNTNRDEYGHGNVNRNGNMVNDGFAPTAALYDNLPANSAQTSKYPDRY